MTTTTMCMYACMRVHIVTIFFASLYIIKHISTEITCIFCGCIILTYSKMVIINIENWLIFFYSYSVHVPICYRRHTYVNHSECRPARSTYRYSFFTSNDWPCTSDLATVHAVKWIHKCRKLIDFLHSYSVHVQIYQSTGIDAETATTKNMTVDNLFTTDNHFASILFQPRSNTTLIKSKYWRVLYSLRLLCTQCAVKLS